MTESAPGDRLSAQLAGDDLAAKIDALHVRHFAGGALGADTALWNAVHAFKEDVKRLAAEMGAGAADGRKAEDASDRPDPADAA